MSDRKDCRVAIFSGSTVGSNLVVAAPGSGGGAVNIGGPNVGSVFVWQVLLGGSGANVLTFQSGATPVYGPIEFTGDGSAATLQYTGAPWFKSLPGQALNLGLSTTATVSGSVYFTVE